MTEEELPTPAEIHSKALEKGWETVGVKKSYSTKSKIIHFHPKRVISGKIYYNSSEIPEISGENSKDLTASEIHSKALKKGWKILGVEKSYSTKSKTILFHPDRVILGKIYYNSKEIPEITP